MTTFYLWLANGCTAPAGYVFTGAVSRWPDTGNVRARLYASR